MASWVRLWHDMPTDPKFRTIARAAKQPLPTVVAVFTFLMADSSANETERGRTTATDEDIASAFDLEESDVSAIKKAMQGRVLNGDMLAGWSKRQPKKEDDSAARAKAWRAQKQAEAESERLRTKPNYKERPDTDTDTDKIKKKDSRSISKEMRPAVIDDVGDKFLEFWKSVPRRQGPNPRKPAEQKFRSLVKTGVDSGFLICEAKKWADAEAAAGKIGTPYIAQTITWLNQQRWIDHAVSGLIGRQNDPGSQKLNDREESRRVLDALKNFTGNGSGSGPTDTGVLRLDSSAGQGSVFDRPDANPDDVQPVSRIEGNERGFWDTGESSEIQIEHCGDQEASGWMGDRRDED